MRYRRLGSLNRLNRPGRLGWLARLVSLAMLLIFLMGGYYIVRLELTQAQDPLSTKPTREKSPPLPGKEVVAFIIKKTATSIDTPPTPKAPGAWELVWSEEFDSPELDFRYWTLQTGANCWGNAELQHYTDRKENCYIQDGRLIICGLKEDYQNSQYTSARITTKEKLDFLYGRFDIRAKLPAGQGLLPAFWLLPTTDTYHDRRRNGEVDLMEMLGQEPRVIYGVAHYQSGKQRKSYGKYFNPRIDFSRDFHVFSLEWSPDRLKWLVDDQPYYSLNLPKTFGAGYHPYNTEFYLIMNLAIGGNWPGPPTDPDVFPAKMEIDYVRYYKSKASQAVR